MENEQMSRLGIAFAVSIGVHLLAMVVGEVTSDDSATKPLKAPPVEITRVAMDGTPLPSGKGDSSFNSPAVTPNASFGQKYDLDAGVPTKIPIPPPDVKVQSKPNSGTENRNPANPSSSGTVPTQSNPKPQNNPDKSQLPTDFLPPMNQGTENGSGNPSEASRPSTAGNLGQKRSRGPNRVAFPEFTVEPQVPIGLITSGVTSSVDVSVDIAADGAHSERIVRSSGSQQVDDLVLAALKQWRWDPAAREGQAIASTQNFKFTFKPH